MLGMSEPVPLPPADYPGPTPDPEMVALADAMRAEFEAEQAAAIAEIEAGRVPPEGGAQ